MIFLLETKKNVIDKIVFKKILKIQFLLTVFYFS